MRTPATDPDLAEINCVHYVAGGYFFNQIEIARIYADSGGVKRKSRRIRIQIIDQLGPVGCLAKLVIPGVVVVVCKRPRNWSWAASHWRVSRSVGIIELVGVAEFSADFDRGEMRADVVALPVSRR